MHDPLLGGAAEQACVKTGADVEAWLQKSGKSIDATLSSVLSRAMETALRSYPKYAKPLFVAPYIREIASGLSNAPRSQQSQVTELASALEGTDFNVDYQWVNAFGIEDASWDKFKHFLANSFLPDFVARSNKTQGSTIVLAVVTHSNFMRDSEIGDKCAHFWENRGADKALNNQVLKMSYTWKVNEPSPGSVDATPAYDLVEGGVPCEEVSGGQSTKDASGKTRSLLCLRDIGKCAKPIAQFAWSPGTLWAKTYEKQLADMKARRWRAVLRKAAADATIREISHGENIGFDVPTHAKLIGFDVPTHAKLIGFDVPTHAKWKLSQADKEIQKVDGQIARHMEAACWSGGHPQLNLDQDEVPW